MGPVPITSTVVVFVVVSEVVMDISAVLLRSQIKLLGLFLALQSVEGHLLTTVALQKISEVAHSHYHPHLRHRYR